MRTGAGFFSLSSTLTRLASSALALVGLLLFNASAHGGSSPFIPHSDRLAEAFILDEADQRLSFAEVQARRQDFKKFHGVIDGRRHGRHFWVHIRWSPSPQPLLLQIRHGSSADITVFQADFPNDCAATKPPANNTLPDSFSDWRDFHLCPGTTEAYVRFSPHTGYPRVNFRVVAPEKAIALNFIETASVFAAGGLGVLSCLLALVRIGSRGWDPLALGFLVDRLSLLPFWASTLSPPPFTNIGKLKLAASILPLEFWRLAVPVGYLIFILLLLSADKQWSRWHRALAVLTGAGVLALVSSAFGALSDYTEIVWGLMFISLPLSLIIALGNVSRSLPLAGPAFGKMPLTQAKWGVAVLVLVVWINTVGMLAELTPDTALVLAMAFYLAMGTSVLIKAGEDSRQALTTALTDRLAREQAQREATLQSQQHAETRDLLLMLTHELRTPLGVLRFSLDAARTMPAARLRAEEAIRNMDSLVERCLQTAHLERDAVAESPDRWNPALEIPILVQQCRAPERVQLHIAANSPAAITRRRILSLIISVLLDNALKYGMTNGTTQLEVQPEVMNGAIGLSIAVDNTPGPAGLPDPQRVFRKYYRSPGAHQYSGAGLGLYLSKQLMERLNGQITYEPLPNTTRFKIWIPC